MSLTPRLDKLSANILHNGNFDFWQRGTSQSTSLGSVFGSADRWRLSLAGSPGVGTLSRATSVPNSSSRYSARFQVSTAQPTLTSSDGVRIVQFVEGNFIKQIIGNYVTLSFYFRTNKSGIYSVAIQNVGATRSYVAQFTVSGTEATNQSWVKRAFYISLESAGWLVDNTRSLTVVITLADSASVSQSTSINQWSAGYNTWYSGQVNLMDTVGNYAEISQAMLLEGDSTEAEFCMAGKTYEEELRLCQRYYEKSYNFDTAPGTIADPGSVRGVLNGSGNRLSTAVYFKCSKRTTPAITVFNPVSGSSGSLRSTDGAANRAVAGPYSIGDNSFSAIDCTGVASEAVVLHWTADAEL